MYCRIPRSSQTTRLHGEHWSRPVISCWLIRLLRWPNSPLLAPSITEALSSRMARSLRHGPSRHLRTSAPTPELVDSSFRPVQEYKGVDDLLSAFSAIPDGIAAHLTVAGKCDDPELRSRLHELADTTGARVVLRLEHVPEEEVALLFAATEVVVLPFRRVTTSGSAMLALSHGKPLIVPDLPGLADLPDKAVLRYGGGIQRLPPPWPTWPAPTMKSWLRCRLPPAVMHEDDMARDRGENKDRNGLGDWRRSGGWPVWPTDESTVKLSIMGIASPAHALKALGNVFNDALYRSSLVLLTNTIATSAIGFVFWTMAAHRYGSYGRHVLGVTSGVTLLGNRRTRHADNHDTAHCQDRGPARTSLRGGHDDHNSRHRTMPCHYPFPWASHSLHATYSAARRNGAVGDHAGGIHGCRRHPRCRPGSH